MGKAITRRIFGFSHVRGGAFTKGFYPELEPPWLVEALLLLDVSVALLPESSQTATSADH